MTRKRLEHDPAARLEALEQTVAYLLALIGDQMGIKNNASATAGVTEIAKNMLPAIAPERGPIRQAALDIGADAMGYASREFGGDSPVKRGH